MRFLIKFWPVWIPLIVYVIWRMALVTRAKRRGEDVPPVTRGPILTTIFATLGIAIACFLWLGISEPASDDIPVPPHVVDGKIVRE
jgi:hypothetical protein